MYSVQCTVFSVMYSVVSQCVKGWRQEGGGGRHAEQKNKNHAHTHIVPQGTT